MTATTVDWKAEVSQMVLAAGDQLVAAGLTRGLMCTADYDRPHGHAWLGARGTSASVEVMAITPETSEWVRREWPEYAHMLLPAGVHVFARVPEPWLRDRSLVSTPGRPVPGWNPGSRGAYYRGREDTIEEAVALLAKAARPPD